MVDALKYFLCFASAQTQGPKDAEAAVTDPGQQGILFEKAKSPKCTELHEKYKLLVNRVVLKK